MSTDPHIWIKTLPVKKSNNNEEEFKLDENRWINTIPKKNKNSFNKKYYFIISLFIVGLIFTPLIKNATRNLQKEIKDLKSSINYLKLDLHQATLDHEVIKSPENISKLAKIHLESGYLPYKKSQIKQLSDQLNTTSNEGENSKKKIDNLKASVKQKINKKINQKKKEIEKLKTMYENPETVPDEIKLGITKQIVEKKKRIKKHLL